MLLSPLLLQLLLLPVLPVLVIRVWALVLVWV
jgi:hypothetical protein